MKKKHIAEQYEFNLERPFVIYDKVVVVPDEKSMLNNVEPVLKTIFAKVVEVLPSFLLVKDEVTGKMYPVYPRQCTLRN